MERFRPHPEDYTVGWACALPIELDAAKKMLDAEHGNLPQQTDHPYLYTLGEINNHNVVIVCLPAGQIGPTSAAATVAQMKSKFPSLQFILMVGIGGGVPSNEADIRLGDVVVSHPRMDNGGVVQYDFGKSTPSGFIRTGFLNAPPTILLSVMAKLQADRLAHQREMSKVLSRLSNLRDNSGPDNLFKATYEHIEGPECDKCDKDRMVKRKPRDNQDIVVHFGTIASGNQVIRDGVVRDKLSLDLGGVLCFEMEAAGLMNLFPSLVIRGICDYADSHKNKKWQPYAALTAAALAKEILSILPSAELPIAKSADLSLDPLRFSNLSKRPEWRVTQEGTSPYNIFDYISDYEPENTYQSYIRSKCPGTATWILNDPVYLAWRRRKSPSCLWLSGKIGSGKTLVTSTVIQNMTDASAKNGDFVGHFFFDHSSKSRLKADHLFSSYIKQILGFLEIIGKTCARELTDAVKRFYGPKRCRPSFDELIGKILLPLSKFLAGVVPSATYIVDGLDECDVKERRRVLETFRKMMLPRYPLRIFVSGREDLHVANFIESSTSIRITNTNNKEDISAFIEWRIVEKMRERQLTENQSVLQDIKDKLNERADLMILWVNMQIEALWDDCSTDSDIKEALENLPKSLDETYYRCLARIDKRQIRFAPRILRWVSAAIKPFQVDQLREALAVDLNSGCLDREQMPTRQDIVKCCSNLITSNNDQILLAHHSVRQFLEERLGDDTLLGEPFQLPGARRELGEICVTHLMSADYGLALQPTRMSVASQPIVLGPAAMMKLTEVVPGWMRPVLRKSKPTSIVLPSKASKPPPVAELPSFFQYAKEQWAPLTRGLGYNSTQWENFRKLALEPNLSWRLHPWPPTGESLDSHYSGLLGWSIVNGHLPLIDALLSLQNPRPKSDIFNVPFFHYGSLPGLHLAARAGDTEIVRRLLPYCNPKKMDNNRRTALHHAAELGHELIILLLFQNKDTLKAQDDKGRTALHCAAENGHHLAVRDLLDRGADINAKDGDKRTPLFLASASGHEAVVRVLISRGGNVNMEDGNGQTPLFAAAENLQGSMVRILVDLGATKLMRDGLGRTARSIAVERALKTLRELSPRGVATQTEDQQGPLNRTVADVSDGDAVGTTVLMMAAASGHKEIIQLLVTLGEDIKKKDSRRSTVLMKAAAAGHKEVIQLLVGLGAEADMKGYEGSVLLMLAADGGHDEVVGYLQSLGADFNARDNSGWTVLMRTASRGLQDEVGHLVKYGADVNAKDQFGWTALLRAAAGGHKATVQLLVNLGADRDAKDQKGWTALTYASCNGCSDVVRALLELGADVNARDDWGSTALIEAAERGRRACLQELIELGADVSAQDEKESTALMRAAANGRETTMQLLLESSGTSIDAKDGNGYTDLMRAAAYGLLIVVESLIRLGADIDIKDHRGSTAIMHAADNGHTATVSLLFELGADIDSGDGLGWTVLMRAAAIGQTEVVRLLLKLGADVNAIDAFEWTALMGAADGGHIAVVHQLLKVDGTNIQAKDRKGSTALMRASGGGHEAVVDLLLYRGADVNARDGVGSTALIRAASGGHLKTIRSLVIYGAEIEAKDNFGRSAVMLAILGGHSAAVLLLDNLGAKFEPTSIMLLHRHFRRGTASTRSDGETLPMKPTSRYRSTKW